MASCSFTLSLQVVVYNSYPIIPEKVGCGFTARFIFYRINIIVRYSVNQKVETGEPVSTFWFIYLPYAVNRDSLSDSEGSLRQS